MPGLGVDIYLAALSNARSLTPANPCIRNIRNIRNTIRIVRGIAVRAAHGGCTTSPPTIGRYPTQQREPSLLRVTGDGPF